MSRLLLRTNVALEDCERHLVSVNAVGTEIESYLTQYLLVILCAEVQQELYSLVEGRAAVAKDHALTSFVSLSSRKVLRSVKKSEIAGFLEMFGAGCKEKFNGKIDDLSVAVYNNAVASRHDVAHKNGSQVTFKELKDAVTMAEKLLVAAAEAIV
jgi:hypothetical protein